jgi:hypothetical protein
MAGAPAAVIPNGMMHGTQIVQVLPQLILIIEMFNVASDNFTHQQKQLTPKWAYIPQL